MTHRTCVRALVALASLALASACGGETEGESIAVRWQVAGADGARGATRSRPTPVGTSAWTKLGCGIDSVFAIAPAPQGRGAVARLSDLFVSVAHAHGGHDDANGLRVRAEWLDPFALDALADEFSRNDWGQ